MAITRRTFIKGAAAVPFAALPGLSFAKASASKLPTADDVLTFGNLWDLERPLTDDETKNLYAEVASQLYVELDQEAGFEPDYDNISDIWMGRVNNFFEFQVAYSEPHLMCFGSVAMVQHYHLPLLPGKIACFDDFHAKAGDYIIGHVDSVYGSNEWDLMLDDISRVIDSNPKCFSASRKYIRKLS